MQRWATRLDALLEQPLSIVLVSYPTLLIVVLGFGNSNYRGFKVSHVLQVLFTDNKQTGGIPNQALLTCMAFDPPVDICAQTDPNQFALVV
jgi:hypothetical protein